MLEIQKKQELYVLMQQYGIPLLESTKQAIEGYGYSENTIIRVEYYNIEVFTDDKGYNDMLYIKRDGTYFRTYGNNILF